MANAQELAREIATVRVLRARFQGYLKMNASHDNQDEIAVNDERRRTRRRFQYGLRTLLIVVPLLGMLLGWAGIRVEEELGRRARQRALTEAVMKYEQIHGRFRRWPCYVVREADGPGSPETGGDLTHTTDKRLPSTTLSDLSQL